MDPIATETTEAPVVDSKVTEKVVEEVEDTPVVASGEDNESEKVEDAPAPTTTEVEEAPAATAVASEVDGEVTENGNGEAEVAKAVDDADESVKRKVDDDEVSEVPEKRAKTGEVEAVEPTEEEATA